MTAYVLRFILTVLDCKLKIAVKQFYTIYGVNCVLQIQGHILLVLKS